MYTVREDIYQMIWTRADESSYMDKCREYILSRNPKAKIIPICAKTGEGIEEWAAWLSESEGKRVLIPDLNVYLAAEPGNDEEMYRNYYGFSGCFQIPDAAEGGV